MIISDLERYTHNKFYLEAQSPSYIFATCLLYHIKLNFMLKSLFIITFFVFITSCSIEERHSEVDRQNSSHATLSRISINEALNNLNSFLSTTNTKSPISNIEVSSIIAIGSDLNSDKAVKSSLETKDTLLYVINFLDNQGSAILAADSRLPTDVYAVIESGEIKKEDFEQTEELNPLSIIHASVLGHMSTYDTVAKDPSLDQGFIPIGEPPMQDHPKGEWIITEWGSWQNKKEIPVMINTRWHQEVPFNNYVLPNAAGCTTIALFQIMAYNNYPNNHVINGIDMLYSTLREIKYINSSSSPYADQVATFVQNFHNNYMNLHFEGETLIFPIAAKKYLKSAGYKNVTLHKDGDYCDLSTIESSLNKGYPVFIAALANGLNGHSWVIDGLIRQDRYGRKIGKESGKIYRNLSQSRTFLHCNWGWGGMNDGYFYAGIFNSNYPVSLQTNMKTLSESDGNYRHNFRIITYDIH